MSARRPDLAVMLHHLARAVGDAEVPVLGGHGLEMWDYVVLGALEPEAAPTQSQLATAVGRDKTRLIPILDRLEGRGLLQRTPDPDDRRNRIVTLTESGRATLDEGRDSVRALEDELLAGLAPQQRLAFLAVLQQLAASVVPGPPS